MGWEWHGGTFRQRKQKVQWPWGRKTGDPRTTRKALVAWEQVAESEEQRKDIHRPVDYTRWKGQGFFLCSRESHWRALGTYKLNLNSHSGHSMWNGFWKKQVGSYCNNLDEGWWCLKSGGSTREGGGFGTYFCVLERELTELAWAARRTVMPFTEPWRLREGVYLGRKTEFGTDLSSLRCYRGSRIFFWESVTKLQMLLKRSPGAPTVGAGQQWAKETGSGQLGQRVPFCF